MADVQHVYDIRFNGEENAVNMWLVTVEQLPHLYSKEFVFGSKGAAAWQMFERSDGIAQALEPTRTGLTGFLLS